MWRQIIYKYWQVSTFRETPANTPYSPLLLGLIAFLFLIEVILQWLIAGASRQFSFMILIPAGLSLIASYFLFTWLLVKYYGRTNRAVQTITALLASYFFIHLFAFPLLGFAPFLADLKVNQVLAFLSTVFFFSATLGLVIWQFLIAAYIYRYALEVDYFTSLLMSFGLLAFNILTILLW